MEYTLGTAKEWASKDKLNDWVNAYLLSRAEPNHGLLHAISNRRGYWMGPIRVRLAQLWPCSGSQSDSERDPVHIVHPVPDEKWERAVDDIQRRIGSLDSVAPLIVHYNYDQLGITDGNHRYALYRRLHLDSCWIVVELANASQEIEVRSQISAGT